MMKRKNSFVKNGISSKAALCLITLIAAMGMTACAEPEKQEQTLVTITKEGAVSLHIAESFDKPYYDLEELKQMVLTEAADYNRMVGAGNISVEKIAVEDGMAVVEMTCLTDEDYAAFHNSVFFVGTVKEAQEAGYDLNTVLGSTKDGLETIGMSDMLAMEEYRILITDRKEPVQLPGKAEYVSDSVIYSNNLRTVTFGGEEAELAYVMYR